jgi:hypothetical protein
MTQHSEDDLRGPKRMEEHVKNQCNVIVSFSISPVSSTIFLFSDSSRAFPFSRVFIMLFTFSVACDGECEV